MVTIRDDKRSKNVTMVTIRDDTSDTSKKLMSTFSKEGKIEDYSVINMGNIKNKKVSEVSSKFLMKLLDLSVLT